MDELIDYDAGSMMKAPQRQDFKSATILKKYYDSEMDNIMFPTPQNQKRLTEDSIGDEDFGSVSILPNISSTPRRKNNDTSCLEMTQKTSIWNAQIVPETIETVEPPECSTRALKFHHIRNDSSAMSGK